MTGLLAAAPAGDFTFEGREASARTTSPVGFFAQGTTPYPNLYRAGPRLGDADRRGPGRPGRTRTGTGAARGPVPAGQIDYRVELTQPGFPPAQAGRSIGCPSGRPRPGYSVEGGVILDRDMNGGSGLGWPATTRVHAAMAVWGVGSVWRNGQLLTDSAVIQAAALSARRARG